MNLFFSLYPCVMKFRELITSLNNIYFIADFFVYTHVYVGSIYIVRTKMSVEMTQHHPGMIV